MAAALFVAVTPAAISVAIAVVEIDVGIAKVPDPADPFELAV
jgi:hypothetical protein